MTENFRSADVDTVGNAFREEQDAANSVLQSILSTWDRNGVPDASMALVQFPFLRRHSSAVISLIYEEYCRRTRQGECVDEADLCRRFPDYSTQIHRQFAVHNRLADPIAMLRDVPVEVWPTPDSLFLGYRIIDEIARGAIARVFLARELATGERLVVLKISLRGAGEAEIMGRLEHSNIVPILSVREDERTELTAVCMPFLSLTTLADVIEAAFASGTAPRFVRELSDVILLKNTKALPETPERRPPRWLRRGPFAEGVARLGLQLAEALAYTHRQGVLHRDIKPSNVLMTQDGRAMLMDFNLSTNAQTLASRVGGTLPYMSPEQIQEVGGLDADAPVDERSDIFSLGVVLFHSLTGQLPFGRPADAPFSRAAAADWLAQQHRATPSVRKLNPRVDRRLAEAIERCLQLDPLDRPQSAGELVGWLERGSRPAPRARRWMLANPVPAWAIIMGAAVVVSSATALVVSREPAWKRYQQQGEKSFAAADYDEAARYFRLAIAESESPAAIRKEYARALQRKGMYDAALSEYRLAYEATREAQLAAEIAYCLQHQGIHRAAAQYYMTAIDDGYDNAAIRNNLGVCYWNSTPNSPNAVIEQFAASEAHQPDFVLPILNRLRFRIQRASMNHEPPGTAAMADSERLIQLHAHTAEVYVLAAAAQVLADRVSPDSRAKVIELLRQGIAVGASRREIEGVDIFHPLRDMPEYQACLRQASATPSAPPLSRILDPLADSPPTVDRR